ncbi:MAG: CDP-alcohol phosphatidyltransferase family protein [Deltaproteobacteria bacterium]|nr:CDP-alcohol phosphatidyltransferase family protein [Deltaproteobacteria bacterium]
MWPAHLLTLSRIPIAIGLWWVTGLWAVALVGLAALTDTLDGNLARWLRRRGHTRPDIGGWLDPVVDKLFVLIVVIALSRTVDPLVLILLATREILLIAVAIFYLARRVGIRDLHADALGKAATIAQFVALAIVLALNSRQESRFQEWGLAAAAFAGVLGFAAAIHYWRVVARMHKYTRPASQREMSITASSAR